MPILNNKYLLLLCFVAISFLPVNGQFIEYIGPKLAEEEIEFHQSAKDSEGNIYFLTNNFKTQQSTIHRYNGSFWLSSKPTSILHNFGNLIPFKEEIIISNQSNNLELIMHLNQNVWTSDTCFFSSIKGGDSTSTLVSHKDKLYFFGSAFGSIGNVTHQGSAVYDGTAWSKSAIQAPKYIYDGMSQFDTLYLLGSWRNQGPKKMYAFFNDVLIDSVQDVDAIKATDNYLFYSVGTTWFWNDGTKLIQVADTLKGVGVQQITEIDEWNMDVFIYGGVAGTSGLYSTESKRFWNMENLKNTRLHATKYGHFISPAVNALNETSYLGKIHWNAAKLEGKMFVDLDGDCAFTTTDLALPNRMVSFDGISTITDENGDYSIFVPIDVTDTLAYLQASFDTFHCNKNTITTALDSIHLNNIVFQSKDIVQDLSVSVTGAIVRHGRKTYYKVIVENQGSIMEAGKEIRVHFDARMANFTSNTSHTLNGNQAIFTLPNLNRSRAWEFVYSLDVDQNQLNLGDSVYTYLDIDVKDDADTSNNFDTLKQFVVSAYDPNLKKCLPYGDVQDELDVIQYTIHFQNTGNDTAFRVIVVDTLERNLPIEKVQIIGISHPKYTLNVIGNTIIWTFDDILLPDSGRNYAESQGWIKFNVKLKRDLEIGDSIRNRAHIYFDYQNPITTNYARLLRIEEPIDSLPEDVKILVYPNPAKDYIDIRNNELSDITFELYDITGRKIMEQEVLSGEIKQVNTSFLSTGFYVMRYEEGCLGKLFISE